MGLERVSFLQFGVLGLLDPELEVTQIAEQAVAVRLPRYGNAFAGSQFVYADVERPDRVGPFAVVDMVQAIIPIPEAEEPGQDIQRIASCFFSQMDERRKVKSLGVLIFRSSFASTSFLSSMISGLVFLIRYYAV